MEDGLGVDESPKKVEHHFLLTDYFNKYCPFLISLGMSYEQFWEGDPTMVKDYMEAFKIKQKRELQIKEWTMWKQGLYVYEAICNVSPVLRAFSKIKKPLPYPKQPYYWDEKQTEEDEKIKKLKEERDVYRTQIFFKNWVNNQKQKFNNKK